MDVGVAKPIPFGGKLSTQPCKAPLLDRVKHLYSTV